MRVNMNNTTVVIIFTIVMLAMNVSDEIFKLLEFLRRDLKTTVDRIASRPQKQNERDEN